MTKKIPLSRAGVTAACREMADQNQPEYSGGFSTTWRYWKNAVVPILRAYEDAKQKRTSTN